MGPIVYNVTLQVHGVAGEPTRLPSYMPSESWQLASKVAARAMFARLLLCGFDHALEVAVSKNYRRARQVGLSIARAGEPRHHFERWPRPGSVDRCCPVCGERDIPRDAQAWPWWVAGYPAHEACSLIAHFHREAQRNAAGAVWSMMPPDEIREVFTAFKEGGDDE
jgi:hypothetical protein